jgi:hypothetical protein
MNTNTAGDRLANGTWTGGLGLLQYGSVDTWANSVFMSLERSNEYVYTTPFIVERHAALLSRHGLRGLGRYIDVDSIGAGVDAMIYGISFALLVVLLVVSCLTEWCNVYPLQQSNSLWRLVLSLLPLNAQMWPNQFGVTRKVLMTTCGFAILILSSLYQAKLSEQLLIPYPPSVVALADIENAVLYDNAEVLVESTAVSEYVKAVWSPSIHIREQELSTPDGTAAMLNTINNGNAIFISTESGVLFYLAQNIDCSNYVYVPLDEWTRRYSALIVRKERVDILESMNVIVAERMSYIDKYVQSYHLSDECHKHIFPVHTQTPRFESLQVLEFTGALTMLFIFSCMSVLILFVEIVWYKWYGAKTATDTKIEYQTFVIQMMAIDDTFTSVKRQEIFEQYSRLLDVIDN